MPGEYEVLDEEAPPAQSVAGKATVRLPFTDPPTDITLDHSGQHTLVWDQPICHDGVCIAPGKCLLYTYPSGYAGEQLALLDLVVVHLGTTPLFEKPDAVGAYPIHATLVCNTPAGLNVSFAALQKNPRLLLQVHGYDGPFAGETSLHIMCANKLDDRACQMIDLASKNFNKADLTFFLSNQATGVFFQDQPMRWYGDSPLGYACVFGCKNAARKMLDTGMVRLDDKPAELTGFYPLHAVVANGYQDVYNWMTNELPAELRADPQLISSSGKLVSLNLDDMNVTQLACKMGLRSIFQHVVKANHTTVLWKWGPVTAYQIDLTGIDSTGKGAADVMEIVARQDATHITQSFVLDDFMQGFLFKLFQQKWAKLSSLHYLWRLLDVVILVIIMFLCVELKVEKEKQLHAFFISLFPLFGLSLLIEAWVAGLFARNISGSISWAEKSRRTWKWAGVFDIDLKLAGYTLIVCAALLYLFGPQEPGIKYDQEQAPIVEMAADHYKVPSAVEDEGDGAAEAARRLVADTLDGALQHGRQLIGGRGISKPSADTNQLIPGSSYQKAVEEALIIEHTQLASIDGTDPIIWMLMAFGFLLSFVTFAELLVMPMPWLSVFVLSVRSVLGGELLIFMSIFLVCMAAFGFTMFTIYPEHDATSDLPQVPEFATWWQASEAIIMLGFTGSGFDIQPNPKGLAELGTWQALDLGIFMFLYMGYIFFSIILLLNMLIALLGDTFSKTQDESILQGRIAYAQCVLRLELIAASWGLDTHAGEKAADKYVHNFRDTELNPDGEVPKGQTSEDIFDPPEEIMPAWAVNLTKMHEELAKDVRRKSSGSTERGGINGNSRSKPGMESPPPAARKGAAGNGQGQAKVKELPAPERVPSPPKPAARSAAAPPAAPPSKTPRQGAAAAAGKQEQGLQNGRAPAAAAPKPAAAGKQEQGMQNGKAPAAAAPKPARQAPASHAASKATVGVQTPIDEASG